MAGLSDELVREVGDLFALLMRSAGGGRDDGPALTTTQRLALIEIATGGPLRLNALAERMATTNPTASRAVEALVGARLAARVADPHDRRAVRIEATARGRREYESRYARVAAELACALEAFDAEEVESLVRSVARLNEELRAGADRPTVALGTLLASG